MTTDRTDTFADRVLLFLDGSSQGRDADRTMVNDLRNLLQEKESGSGRNT